MASSTAERGSSAAKDELGKPGVQGEEGDGEGAITQSSRGDGILSQCEPPSHPSTSAGCSPSEPPLPSAPSSPQHSKSQQPQPQQGPGIARPLHAQNQTQVGGQHIRSKVQQSGHGTEVGMLAPGGEMQTVRSISSSALRGGAGGGAVSGHGLSSRKSTLHVVAGSNTVAGESQTAPGGNLSGLGRVRSREGKSSIAATAGKKRRQVQVLDFDESMKASRVQQHLPARGIPSPATPSGAQGIVVSTPAGAGGGGVHAGMGVRAGGDHIQQQQQHGGGVAQIQTRGLDTIIKGAGEGIGGSAGGGVAGPSIPRGPGRVARGMGGSSRQDNQTGSMNRENFERDTFPTNQRGEGSGSGRGRYSPTGQVLSNDGSGGASAAAEDEGGGGVGGGRCHGQSRVAHLRRPSVKRQSVPVTHYVDSSLERLQREATSMKIRQAAEEKELQPIPGSFDSVEAYVNAFEPLLFEECRAQLHSEWEELCENGGRDGHLPVKVAIVEQREKGWYEVLLNFRDSQAKPSFKENDVAVLSTPKPGPVNRRKGRRGVWQRDSEDVEEGEICARTAGLLRRYQAQNGREMDGIFFRFHVPVEEYESTATLSPGHALRELKSRGGDWWLTPLSGLTTIQREYNSLHLFKSFHPQMRSAILKPRPEMFPKYVEDEPPALPECFTPAFTAHLHNTFNRPQLSAIQWAAAHTAAGGSSRFGNKSNAGADLSTSGGQSQEPWPFTLVQGPPGTGKTHTVWGMLNVIHLVHFQRYYQSLLRKLAPQAVAMLAPEGARHSGNSKGADQDEDGCDTDAPSGIDELLEQMDSNLFRLLPKLCPKPRMLVCAPSNAATDELLARVLERGFIDGEMQQYKPDVARVGMDAQSKAAQAVSVERRTENLLGMKADHCKAWIQELQWKEHAQAQRINELKNDLREIAVAMKNQGAVGVDPEVLVSRDQEKDCLLQRLAEVHEQRDKVLVELSRLLIVESRLRPGGGMSQEEARAKLEASFAREAEIVFTTVSSSGRRLFARLPHGFDTVVIDEAAQASEMAVLPPLSLRCSRCVLVGDPQQLPATVISRVAQTMRYSRSLFERFQQAKCPTILLNVQYRMHPQIRDFPSRYFYEGKLIDAPNVTEMPDEPYHSIKCLSPYIFFDVSKGRESHAGSVSYQNKDEAEFAARLYNYLQNHVPEPVFSKMSIGVITPYKQQLKCLQREFESVAAEKGQIYINTVDAFQGQERDVIIMSCVRASCRGVGFVADIRRMNVALTRARRSLWVLGNANALSQSEDWSALIQDAKARSCYIQAPYVHGLFTDSPPLLPAGKPALSHLGGPPGFAIPAASKLENPDAAQDVTSRSIPKREGTGIALEMERVLPSSKRECIDGGSGNGGQWAGQLHAGAGMWGNGQLPSCGRGFAQLCSPRDVWINQSAEAGDSGGVLRISFPAAPYTFKAFGMNAPSKEGMRGLEKWSDDGDGGGGDGGGRAGSMAMVGGPHTDGDTEAVNGPSETSDSLCESSIHDLQPTSGGGPITERGRGQVSVGALPPVFKENFQNPVSGEWPQGATDGVRLAQSGGENWTKDNNLTVESATAPPLVKLNAPGITAASVELSGSLAKTPDWKVHHCEMTPTADVLFLPEMTLKQPIQPLPSQGVSCGSGSCIAVDDERGPLNPSRSSSPNNLVGHVMGLSQSHNCPDDSNGDIKLGNVRFSQRAVSNPAWKEDVLRMAALDGFSGQVEGRKESFTGSTTESVQFQRTAATAGRQWGLTTADPVISDDLKPMPVASAATKPTEQARQEQAEAVETDQLLFSPGERKKESTEEEKLPGAVQQLLQETNKESAKGGEHLLEHGAGETITGQHQPGKEDEKGVERGFTFDLNLTAEENMRMTDNEVENYVTQRQTGSGGSAQPEEVCKTELLNSDLLSLQLNGGAVSLTSVSNHSDGRRVAQLEPEQEGEGQPCANSQEASRNTPRREETHQGIWESTGGRTEPDAHGLSRKRTRQSFLSDGKEDEVGSHSKILNVGPIATNDIEGLVIQVCSKDTALTDCTSEGRVYSECRVHLDGRVRDEPDPSQAEVDSRRGGTAENIWSACLSATSSWVRGHRIGMGRGENDDPEVDDKLDKVVRQPHESRWEDGIHDSHGQHAGETGPEGTEIPGIRVRPQIHFARNDGMCFVEQQGSLPSLDRRARISAGPSLRRNAPVLSVAGLTRSERHCSASAECVGRDVGSSQGNSRGAEVENELEELKDEDWRHIRMTHCKTPGQPLHVSRNLGWDKGCGMDPESSSSIVEQREQQGRIWNEFVGREARISQIACGGPVTSAHWGKEWEGVKLRDMWHSNLGLVHGVQPLGIWRENWPAAEGSAGLQSSEEGSNCGFLSLQGGLDKVTNVGDCRVPEQGGNARQILVTEPESLSTTAVRVLGTVSSPALSAGLGPLSGPGLGPAPQPPGMAGQGMSRGWDLQWPPIPGQHMQEPETVCERFGRNLGPTSS